MTTYTIHMIFERETKGALRYQEATEVIGEPKGSNNWVPLTIADGALVGNLYLRKSILPSGTIPDHLNITIEATP